MSAGVGDWLEFIVDAANVARALCTRCGSTISCGVLQVEVARRWHGEHCITEAWWAVVPRRRRHAPNDVGGVRARPVAAADRVFGVVMRRASFLDAWTRVIKSSGEERGAMDTERVDGALALVPGSFDGWWVIERAPVGRLLDADVEGTAEEMRALARAIRDRGHYSAKRCAVDVGADRVYLWSPRNSMCRAVVSLTAADSLALMIDTTLGTAGRESEAPLPDFDIDPTPLAPCGRHPVTPLCVQVTAGGQATLCVQCVVDERERLRALLAEVRDAEGECRARWLACEQGMLAAEAERDRLRDALRAYLATVDEERRAHDLYDRTPVPEMAALAVAATARTGDAERALRAALERSRG